MNILSERQNKLFEFVKEAHGDQKRKYTHEPYWHHLKEVAEIVYKYSPEGNTVEVALCHDLFEDTQCQKTNLYSFLRTTGYNNEIAMRICYYVSELTDKYTKEEYPYLNRKTRKELETERMSKIPPICQTVKYADMISNTQYIVERDKGFAEVYLNEKYELLNKMRMGNLDLFVKCYNLLNDSLLKL